MRKLRTALAVLLATSGLIAPIVTAPAAQATSRSVIIQHLPISEADWIGILNYGSSAVQWVLYRGYTANNRAGAYNADTRGYNLGLGWCARTYVLRLDVPGANWTYTGTVGPGNHYPLPSQRIYGIEPHPAHYGGANGCG